MLVLGQTLEKSGEQNITKESYNKVVKTKSRF